MKQLESGVTFTLGLEMHIQVTPSVYIVYINVLISTFQASACGTQYNILRGLQEVSFVLFDGSILQWTLEILNHSIPDHSVETGLMLSISFWLEG